MKFIINNPEEIEIEASITIGIIGDLMLRLNGEPVLYITPDGLLRKLDLFGTSLPIQLNKQNAILELLDDGTKV
jgi:hypothetical protein